MSKSIGVRIWSFINSPLIVVLIILILLPISIGISATILISRVKNEAISATGEIAEATSKSFRQLSQEKKEEQLEQFKVYKLIKIKNVKIVLSFWKSNEKVIGTIVNNSNEIIQSIKVTASFYDKNGNLIDVVHDWLSEAKFILPKEEANFSFTRDLGDYKESEEVLNSRKADSVEVKISCFSILEKEKS